MSEAAVPLPIPQDPTATDRPWKAELALLVAAFFFGTTFVVVQDAIESVAPLPFLALRFLLAAALLWLLARRRPATPHEARHGLLAGSVLWAGYVLQTVGLQYTDPATSAFLTYMLVVIVPVIVWAMWRRRPSLSTLAGIALAVIGLLLLTGVVGGSGAADGSAAAGGNGAAGYVAGRFDAGELLTLGCAVAFAVHILIVNQVTQRHDPLRFTFVQLLTVGALSTFGTGVDRTLAVLRADGGDAAWTDGLHFDAAALAAAAFTGVFATALAFVAMVWAQRVVSPSRAALILLMETVFAAGLAWLAGDRLSGPATVGAALILLGVVAAEVVPLWRGTPAQSLDPRVKVGSP
jgi:drug/metabolite transporter (DMT)-like permease